MSFENVTLSEVLTREQMLRKDVAYILHCFVAVIEQGHCDRLEMQRLHDDIQALFEQPLTSYVAELGLEPR